MIRVSDDIMINPKRLDAIETRYNGKKKIFMAVIGQKQYQISDIESFLLSLNTQSDEGKQHHFAG